MAQGRAPSRIQCDSSGPGDKPCDPLSLPFELQCLVPVTRNVPVTASKTLQDIPDRRNVRRSEWPPIRVLKRAESPFSAALHGICVEQQIDQAVEEAGDQAR